MSGPTYYRLDRGVPTACTREEWVREMRYSVSRRVIERTRLEGPEGVAQVMTYFVGEVWPADPYLSRWYQTRVIGGPADGAVYDSSTLGAAKTRHWRCVEIHGVHGYRRREEMAG